MDLDTLVAPLRADVESGAATIARTAVELTERAVAESGAREADELRAILSPLAVRMLDAQPSMAPLVHLLSSVLAATEGPGSPGKVDRPAGEPAAVTRSGGDARRRVLAAAAAFRDRLEAEARGAAERALPLLKGGGLITTFSASSTVQAALVRAHEARVPLRVVCLESRPGREGRILARRLSAVGIPVTFAVDAAGWEWVRRSATVLVGADSVGDAGVVNKIGSAALAAAASRAGVPFRVLAARSKLLPPGFSQKTEDDRPPSEVWDAPAGVEVWNQYFEIVPTDLVTGVVTEDGLLSGEALTEARKALDVPPELREWARSSNP